VSFDISYTGDGWITLPSGNWEVKRLAFKMTPEDPSRIASEGESLFSPQLGVIVKTFGNDARDHSDHQSAVCRHRALALREARTPAEAVTAVWESVSLTIGLEHCIAHDWIGASHGLNDFDSRTSTVR
jgi:hypothetical protein